MPNDRSNKVIKDKLPGNEWKPIDAETVDEAIQRAKVEGKLIDPNIWEILRQRQKDGTFKGEIQTIILKDAINLRGGTHYYIIEDAKKRSIACLSCPVKHGGVLEAHMLSRYRIEDGILYLDGKAKNKRADFTP